MNPKTHKKSLIEKIIDAIARMTLTQYGLKTEMTPKSKK